MAHQIEKKLLDRLLARVATMTASDIGRQEGRYDGALERKVFEEITTELLGNTRLERGTRILLRPGDKNELFLQFPFSQDTSLFKEFGAGLLDDGEWTIEPNAVEYSLAKIPTANLAKEVSRLTAVLDEALLAFERQHCSAQNGLITTGANELNGRLAKEEALAKLNIRRDTKPPQEPKG